MRGADARAAEGHTNLEALSARVIRVVMTGHIDAEAGRSLASRLTVLLSKAPPKVTFWDLEAMDTYHSDVRTLCTKALLSHFENVEGITVIAKSKIVKMGVAVANVALGGRITTIDDRASFDAAVQAALRGRAQP